MKVVLLDGTGQLVKVKTLNGEQEMNTIKFTDLSGLSGGFYLIEAVTCNEGLQQKPLKKIINISLLTTKYKPFNLVF